MNATDEYAAIHISIFAHPPAGVWSFVHSGQKHHEVQRGCRGRGNVEETGRINPGLTHLNQQRRFRYHEKDDLRLPAGQRLGDNRFQRRQGAIEGEHAVRLISRYRGLDEHACSRRVGAENGCGNRALPARSPAERGDAAASFVAGTLRFHQR